MQPEGVSIIICGYNAANRIQPTLNALQQQQFSREKINWEVIIIDNASTDNTSLVASEVWKKNFVTAFRIVREEKPGLMHARHKGLSEAKYEIVSFIDDDNWVEPFWVEKVVSVFSIDKNIGACGGSSEAVFETVQPDWFSTYENSFAVGKQAEATGYIENKKGYLWGAGLSIRKSLWQELLKHGFKNLTIGRDGKNVTAGEDTELCFAFRLLGYRLYYRQDLTLKHYMPLARMNFSYFKKMIIGFGKTNVRLNCYRLLLYPESFKFREWWYEGLVAIKSILKLSVAIIFISDQQAKLKAKVNRVYWIGYALQVMKDRKQLKSMTVEIKKVFKNFVIN